MRHVTASLLVTLAAAGCADQTVTETGYLLPPKITYTSPGPLLSSENQDVLLIGEAGAITEPGGGLTVTVARTDVDVDALVNEGTSSFVAMVSARHQDEIRLRYTVGDASESLDFVLRDDLSTVTAAETCAVCAGTIFGAPDQDGNVQVMLNLLEDPSPPFVIANQDSGLAIRVEVISPPPTIAGQSGDRACIHRLSGNAASTVVCETLTE